jgi:hypothetical protein
LQKLALFCTKTRQFFANSLSENIFNIITSVPDQGDQIGRIFAHWAIVYFGSDFFKFQKHPKC